MPALILYHFKLSVCLGGIYLFYLLALRNLTFYNWNRWFLLLGTGLSFLIPVVQLPSFLVSQETVNLKLISGIPTLSKISQPIFYAGNTPDSYPEYLFLLILIIFGAGVFLQASKLLIQFISFFRIRRSAIQLQDGAIKIYQVDKDIAPFSFGNAIFLNKNLLRPAEMEEIVRHELVHISQKHTLDVLWLEFLSLTNWYNPFVWLLKQAVRQNLEFIVNRAVLMSPGLDKKYYQYLLLKVLGMPNLNIANSFNISSLKTRIIMMNKKPSNRRELAKFLLVMPMMATLLWACHDNFDANLKDAGVKQKVSPPPPPPEPEIPAMPPPPPPVVITDVKLVENHNAFLKRNPQVDGLGWQGNNTMVIFFKSGVREEYDLHRKESRVKAEKKFGTLPLAPPS